MKMGLGIGMTMVLYAAIFFLAGVGWGQWWTERQIRQANAESGKGRLQVNMPANPEDAAATLELLSVLVKEAELKRQAAAKKTTTHP
jgi:hypothetical protein